MELPLHYTFKEILQYKHKQKAHLTRLHQISTTYLRNAEKDHSFHTQLHHNHQISRNRMATRNYQKIQHQNQILNKSIDRQMVRPIRDQFKPLKKRLAGRSRVKTCVSDYERDMENLKLIKRLLQVKAQEQLSMEHARKEERQHGELLSKLCRYSIKNQRRRNNYIKEMGIQISVPIKARSRKVR